MNSSATDPLRLQLAAVRSAMVADNARDIQVRVDNGDVKEVAVEEIVVVQPSLESVFAKIRDLAPEAEHQDFEIRRRGGRFLASIRRRIIRRYK